LFLPGRLRQDQPRRPAVCPERHRQTICAEKTVHPGRKIDALANLLLLNQAERAAASVRHVACKLRVALLVGVQGQQRARDYAAIAEVAGARTSPKRGLSQLERDGMVENLISEHNIH
jgi:hypothetical protein